MLVYLPSKCDVFANVIKNCDEFVFGPLFAILNVPGPECLRRSPPNSSGNLDP